MRILVAAVAVLLFPGTAAAATWSPPELVSGGHTFVSPFSPTVTNGGRILAPWTFQDGLGNAGRPGAAAASRASGAAAFGAAKSLPKKTAAVVATGPGGAVLASTNTLVGNPTRLDVRFGHATGTFGRRHTIARGKRIASVSLAANAHGDAVLAWFDDRGVRTDRVWVAIRRAGHGFGAPRRLATGRIRRVAAAIGAKGDVLVSWDARGVVRARYRPHGRRAFGATDTIRSQDAFFDDMHPVVMPSGRSAVAWSAQFLSEGGDQGPQFFQVAVRPAGAGKHFGAARLLDRVDNPVGTDRPIDAVVDGRGFAVAWSAAGELKAVRGAGAARDIGAGFLSDLAAGPGGRLAVVWDEGVDTTPNTVHAALAPAAGAPFGAAETVTPAGVDSFGGFAAFSGNEPTVVYVSRPVRESQSFVTASTRSG